ncbi:MAG: HAD family hydrolase [Deltaproteobacteria bacterium]|nr:HAD family hydrolase [Deltaproteobacteria bacterium]
MNQPYKVIAFDCDGVMFDTAASNRAYYNTLLNRLGMPDMTAGQFSYAHAHTVDETITFLFGDKNGIERAQEIRKTMRYLPFIKEMTMEPHLISLLKKLRHRYQTAIATNRTDTMGSVLSAHHLRPYFDYVVCAGHVIHPKPHPEGLLKIAAHFDIKTAELFYIGDTSVDEAAARDGGVTFTAYGNPDLSAAFHIETLKDLEKILL